MGLLNCVMVATEVLEEETHSAGGPLHVQGGGVP